MSIDRAARRAPLSWPSALATALLLAVAPHAPAQPLGKGAPASSPVAAGPTALYWYDGGVRRPLRIDPDQAARFAAGKSIGAGVVVPAAAVAGKAGSGTEAVSPLLRDESGTPRALPGGVIVTLPAAPADEAAARRELRALGASPLRPIGAGLRDWLVESPAGLESLALANRLQEGGRVAAQPNWWQPRAKK